MTTPPIHKYTKFGDLRVKQDYDEKFKYAVSKINFSKLPANQQEFIKKKSYQYRFSFQEIKKIVEIANDFIMWDETPITDIWPKDTDESGLTKKIKKQIIEKVESRWQELKSTPKSYEDFKTINSYV